MLISYSKKFIFIHIDKAAGASIQDALRPFASPQPAGSFRKRLVWLGKLNRFGGLYRRLQFSEHVNADVIQQCLPVAVYQAMYKFAFVRNPWDRLVSRYSYLLRVKEHPRHEFVKRMGGFEEYLNWEIRRGKMHQYKYVTDPHGKMIVDLICKYETLHEDIRRGFLPAIGRPGGTAARECVGASGLPGVFHAGHAGTRRAGISP